MAVTGSVTLNISVAGITMTGNITASGQGQESHEVALPAGVAATKIVAAVVTVASHAIIGGDRVDVYWTDATSIPRVNYGGTVDSVIATAITLNNNGLGDVLPADTEASPVTSMVICKCVGPLADFNFEPDTTVFMAASADQRSCLTFQTATGSPADGNCLGRFFVTAASAPYYWSLYTGVTIPLTGAPVVAAYASNGSVTAATLKAGFIFVT